MLRVITDYLARDNEYKDPMATFSITLDADDLSDPRPLDLVDLEVELLCRPPIVRARLTGSVQTGGIRLVATVEADDEEQAAHAASEHFARALVATRRTASVARIESAGGEPERRAPLGPVELEGGPLDGWRVTAEAGFRRIVFEDAVASGVTDYRTAGREADDGVPLLESTAQRPGPMGRAPAATRASDEAMRSLVQLAHDLPDLEPEEAIRRLAALGPAHRGVADELVVRMELIARRHRLEELGATVSYERRAPVTEEDPPETHRCVVRLRDGRRFETVAGHERDARHDAYAKAEAELGFA